MRDSKGGRAASSSLNREKKRLETTIRKRRAELDVIANKYGFAIGDRSEGAVWRQEEKERKAFELRSQRRELAREQMVCDDCYERVNEILRIVKG